MKPIKPARKTSTEKKDRVSAIEAKVDFMKRLNDSLVDSVQMHHVQILQIEDSFRNYRFALGIAAVVFILEAVVAICVYSHK